MSNNPYLTEKQAGMTAEERVEHDRLHRIGNSSNLIVRRLWALQCRIDYVSLAAQTRPLTKPRDFEREAIAWAIDTVLNEVCDPEVRAEFVRTATARHDRYEPEKRVRARTESSPSSVISTPANFSKKATR